MFAHDASDLATYLASVTVNSEATMLVGTNSADEIIYNLGAADAEIYTAGGDDGIDLLAQLVTFGFLRAMVTMMSLEVRVTIKSMEM